jgi:multidrug efflux pump subunit AcrB
MILALSSTTVPAGDIYNFAIDVVAQRLSQLKGVGLVDVGGSERSAVRVQLDPAYLAALGHGLEDVRSFLAKSNANLPKGSLDGPSGFYALHVNDQLDTAKDYRSLIAFHGRGGNVRLGDLGRVIDGVENTRRANWFGNRLATQIYISKQTGANVIATVDRIRAELPTIRRWMPPGIDFAVVADRTGTIRASVNHIEVTLLISIALVVAVVFLFLRRVAATIIPSCVIPLALAGTFVAMALAGYTLDNLSLLALAVAVSFIMDDAVVVIENICRHLEAGASSAEAASRGAGEIGPTLVSMTLALIAVFMPLVFMTGLIGRLLHEFAVTLTGAILVSGVASLTFTPMMCSRFLGADAGGVGALRGVERSFLALQSGYEHGLRWALRHRRVMLAATAATLVVTVGLYVIIPKGLFPVEDTGTLQCVAEGAQDISFAAFAKKQVELIDLVLQDPAVDTISSSINNTSNQGMLFINLKPLAERRVDIFTVIARLRRRLASVEGIGLYMQAVQDLRVGARTSKSTYQYTLQGTDWRDLGRWASALVEELRNRPSFQDVTTDLEPAGLEANLRIDRAHASRLGLRLADIDNTLYDAFGQRQVSTIYASLAQHHVVLEASPRFLFDPASLDKIYVKSATGRMIPLSAVARVVVDNAVLVVNHQGQFPAATLSFNLGPGVSLSEATAEIEEATNLLHIPGSIHGSFQGTARAFEDSVASEPWLVAGALLAVYLILGVLYESLLHPLVILSTLPSAGVGALLALILTHNALDVVGLIGIILLIGLVTKNAIMMIDFALAAERRDGLGAAESIARACVLRFRPIMMTTTAAFFCALPLALRGGVGSELHKPLGIAIVGGLIFSQSLTLFSTPVVYVTLDRFRRRRLP